MYYNVLQRYFIHYLLQCEVEKIWINKRLILCFFKIVITVSEKCCYEFKWDKMDNACIGIYFVSLTREVMKLLIILFTLFRPIGFFHEFFYYIYIQVMQLLLACLDGVVGEECDTPCVYPSYGRNCGFICDCMGCLQG